MNKQVLFLFFLFFIGSVSAQYIYGDIYISEGGKATFIVNTDVDIQIKGLSLEDNMLRGETFALTSMSKGVWSFSLELGNYESILLDIHLPGSLERILSLEGVDSLIGFDPKTINLIDTDKALYFKIEYEIEEEQNYFFLYVLVVVAIVVLLLFLLVKLKGRKEKKLEKILPFINDKEKAILELLMKKPRRQKEVRKKLGIPKASYSRYLVNLEKKKLISREGEGKNKILRLK